jgi:hypothetical protein
VSKELKSIYEVEIKHKFDEKHMAQAFLYFTTMWEWVTNNLFFKSDHLPGVLSSTVIDDDHITWKFVFHDNGLAEEFMKSFGIKDSGVKE